MKESLINHCKSLGWIAVACLSIYIIIAFVLSIFGLGFSFIGLIFGAAAVTGDDAAKSSKV